jgi:hypothetical protein
MPKKQSVKKTDGYNLSISMNGEVLDVFTDDLKAELQKITPEHIHTEVFITIKKGLADFTRRLTLHDAKKLFRDSERQDIFLNNLFF